MLKKLLLFAVIANCLLIIIQSYLLVSSIFSYNYDSVSIIIRDESDLPPINDNGEHELNAGKKYIFETNKKDGAIFINNPIRIPNSNYGYGVQITSSSDNQTVIVYQGSGAFIRGDKIPLLFIRELDFIGNGINELFDITGDEREIGSPFDSIFVSREFSANNFFRVGSIKKFNTYQEIFALYTNNRKGITIEDCKNIYIYDGKTRQQYNFLIKNYFWSIKGKANEVIIRASGNPYALEKILFLDKETERNLKINNIQVDINKTNGGSIN